MSAPRLRLVLAVSLDGRLAPPGGGAAQLGGPGDRRVLEESLAWADGCLIGARTLRLHRTTCLIHADDLIEKRRRAGRSAQPIAIVVSRRADLPPDLPFFDQALDRWLLLAPPGYGDGGAGGVCQRPGFHRCLPLRGWTDALRGLGSLGLHRLLVLGGAELAGALLAEDRLDELQLTVCPRLLGGPHVWLSPSLDVPVAARRGWRLVDCRSLPGQEVALTYHRGEAEGDD